MEKDPEPVIENGIVVNADELRKYWAERQAFNRRIQYGCFLDIQRETLYASEKRYNENLGQDNSERVVEHIVRHASLSKQEFALLQEHDRALKYLMGKQTEREKPKRKYKSYS